MNQQMNTSYSERIKKVCDYIESHLDDDLSVETLSQVALFSKFHFHRLFYLCVGSNVARYISLARLKRASYQLAFSPESKVIDIALAAGFENPESFSRAFKNAFSQTPSQFKKQPDWLAWNDVIKKPNIERRDDMNVEIVEFKQTKVAALEHRGSPKLVNDSVTKFIDWRKQSGLSPVKTSQTLGIVYDNPETTEPEDFRFDICGSVNDEVPENSHGVVNKTIPGGRCVRVRHYGSHANIGQVVYYLYGQWLPNSGEELADFPCFFHYRNLITEVDEHELMTDVYLLLR